MEDAGTAKKCALTESEIAREICLAKIRRGKNMTSEEVAKEKADMQKAMKLMLGAKESAEDEKKVNASIHKQ